MGVGSHSGTPALNAENLRNKIGRFSKTRTWIYVFFGFLRPPNA